mmetsp:Transcript_28158/g.36896  ORF Transcript_28158/g.36896 Transcript_28158/m.36896 type:complete len:198 (+) Transcript_28158:14-607(+)
MMDSLQTKNGCPRCKWSIQKIAMIVSALLGIFSLANGFLFFETSVKKPCGTGEGYGRCYEGIGNCSPKTSRFNSIVSLILQTENAPQRTKAILFSVNDDGSNPNNDDRYENDDNLRQMNSSSQSNKNNAITYPEIMNKEAPNKRWLTRSRQLFDQKNEVEPLFYIPRSGQLLQIIPAALIAIVGLLTTILIASDINE